VGPQRHQLHQRARHHDADRETADRLQVSNRLDANESILAGPLHQPAQGSAARETEEPDRTWLALAAYNIGPGHFNAARTLARQLKADPDAWYEMKRVLPLLPSPNMRSS
jgi:membrane-bound lytic murein transglycosylase F